MKSKSGYQLIPVLAVLLFSTMPGFAQSYYSLEFIENKGQWGKQFQYKAEVGTGVFFLQQNGFTVLQHNEADYKRVTELMHGHNHPENSSINKDAPGPDGIRTDQDQNSKTLRSHAYQVTFAGSSPESALYGEQLIQATSNYFIGNDPSKWKTGI
ncbi:MAG: hypothetical protein ACRC2O_01890, partial [Chitinophagaceae bacterium]